MVTGVACHRPSRCSGQNEIPILYRTWRAADFQPRLLSPGFQVNRWNEVTGDVARGKFMRGENVPRQFSDVTIVTGDARQGAIEQLGPLPPGKHSFSLPPEPVRIQMVAPSLFLSRIQEL